jgi:hypothetical protein
MNKPSPLRREGVLIALGKGTWKIVDAGNAINASDLRYWVSLDAPTRLEMESWEAATLLGGLIAETARWSGYPTLHTPVIHVEMQSGVPCIWWDALEQTAAGDTAPVIHKPSKP